MIISTTENVAGHVIVENLGTSETKKETDVEDVWEKWTISMQEYCEQDTIVTHKLYEYFLFRWMNS